MSVCIIWLEWLVSVLLMNISRGPLVYDVIGAGLTKGLYDVGFTTPDALVSLVTMG